MFDHNRARLFWMFASSWYEHAFIYCNIFDFLISMLDAEVCSQPAFTGPCRAAFEKYYFNSATGKCQTFTYGGCNANQNNFETKLACEARCKGKAQKQGILEVIKWLKTSTQ